MAEVTSRSKARPLPLPNFPEGSFVILTKLFLTQSRPSLLLISPQRRLDPSWVPNLKVGSTRLPWIIFEVKKTPTTSAGVFFDHFYSTFLGLGFLFPPPKPIRYLRGFSSRSMKSSQISISLLDEDFPKDMTSTWHPSFT